MGSEGFIQACPEAVNPGQNAVGHVSSLCSYLISDNLQCKGKQTSVTNRSKLSKAVSLTRIKSSTTRASRKGLKFQI